MEYLVPLDSKFLEESQRFITNQERAIDRSPILPVGTKIVHATFGNGKILSIDEGQSCYLIAFDNTPTPKSIVFNAPLTIMQ